MNIETPSSPAGLESTLDNAIANGIGWSVSRQHDDGYWVGKLQSNSCMEAQWLLSFHVMGIKDHPQQSGLIRSLLKEQETSTPRSNVMRRCAASAHQLMIRCCKKPTAGLWSAVG